MQALSWHAQEFQRLAATKSRLAHAVLLKGRRGIGKFVFARALAQALLCEAPDAENRACDACAACAWFGEGNHPDYRQVEPASLAEPESEEAEKKTAISVAQIRALADFINVSSHRGGAKVVVVHPAEALNLNAANALLKSLEEPPPRTHFVLVTHRPHQLLPTIRSRCQQIALPVPGRSVAAAWLAQHDVAEPELALAYTGEAPLLALEFMDNAYWAARRAFMRQLASDDFDPFAAADAVRDCAPVHVIEWLQKWSYDLVHYRSLQRVRYNVDHVEAISRAARRIDTLAGSRFHREMVKLQPFVHHPLNARLLFEDVLLSYRDLLQPHAVAPA
jgi:DNA polymerase-3 subunit delta'